VSSNGTGNRLKAVDDHRISSLPPFPGRPDSLNSGTVRPCRGHRHRRSIGSDHVLVRGAFPEGRQSELGLGVAVLVDVRPKIFRLQMGPDEATRQARSAILATGPAPPPVKTEESHARRFKKRPPFRPRTDISGYDGCRGALRTAIVFHGDLVQSKWGLVQQGTHVILPGCYICQIESRRELRGNRLQFQEIKVQETMPDRAYPNWHQGIRKA
jgi:hypothetical protein